MPKYSRLIVVGGTSSLYIFVNHNIQIGYNYYLQEIRRLSLGSLSGMHFVWPIIGTRSDRSKIWKISYSYYPVCIDEQVHLVHLVHFLRLLRLVHLQTDNFRLFLRQQTDKLQTSICTMTKRWRIKDIAWAIIFRFPCPVLVHVSMSSSMVPCPRSCFNVSISSFICPCPQPCFHVLVHVLVHVHAHVHFLANVHVHFYVHV